MDPERQPLLYPVNHTINRSRRFRPLTHEEVQLARQDVHWRRAQCMLVLLFWGIMATCLSMIACILITAPSCHDNALPSVPPVHMSLAPLISQGRAIDEANSFYAF